MKSFWRLSVVAGLAWGVAACETVEEQGRAAATAQALQASPGYHVILLSSLGGSSSSGIGINNLSRVTGWSALPENETIHATLWFFGFRRDLGTLGGPNSAVLWPVKNTLGLISGVAETAELDPLGEHWSCSAFFPSITGHTCRGFVWERGVMRGLPTLGGNNGFATGTNNLRQTVGWAENTVQDPTCNSPQVLQFRAVIWGPGADQIQELPPLPDDTTSAATAINDAGQVVGISGICDNAVGRFSAAHAVLWEDGTVTDLGDLGGVAWNTPMAINEAGDVVGFANLPVDPPGRFNAHAFLWTRSAGMRDLETLGDDTRSQALGINQWGQVVGVSCGATCRAFIFQDGVMTDLNTLLPSGSPVTLTVAGDINDFGVITGEAVTSSGETKAFVALPTP